MQTDPFARHVLRQRDQASPALTVDWGLLRMLDQPACAMLQEDLKLFAQPWEIRRATKTLSQTLPESAGLYMFVWRPVFSFDLADCDESGSLFQILYVGRAGGVRSNNGNGDVKNGTLRRRYQKYQRFIGENPSDIWEETPTSTRDERLMRYLALHPLEYWYTVVEEDREIPLLEDRLIKLLNPPLNSVGKPRLKTQKPKPAF